MGNGGLTGADLVDRLEKALAPWLPDEPNLLFWGEAFKPRETDAPLQVQERKRYEAYARTKLKERCAEFAAMGKDSGRNNAAFSIAAAIGRYVHHGVLREADAVKAIVAACEANGLLSEDGRPSVQATIRSGLLKARNDPLPDLMDRPRIRAATSPARGKPAKGQPNGSLEEPQTTARRIYLVPFDEIRLSARRRDLIARLSPRVGLIIVWGPAKCGKSFWVFDLAMHVALGWNYRGRRVHQGPVVYCAFEGQTGIEARVEAFRQKHMAEDAEPTPFYLEPVTLNLVADQAELIDVIRRQLPDTNPVLIVLDTLNRSMQGSESNDQDMSSYVRAADAIREAFNCAVIIVHHCGIEGSRPRGHTSLTGAADAQLAVKRDDVDNIIVKVEYAKDGEAGDIIASRLEIVDVGVDEDGEPISSCVVMPVEGNVIAFPKSGRRLAPEAQIALAALEEAIAAHGSVPPTANHIPPNTPTVSLSLWRRYYYQRNPDSGPDISDKQAARKKQEARKKAFQRARQVLQAEHVGVWGTEDGSEVNAQCWLLRRSSGHAGRDGTLRDFVPANTGTGRDTPL